MVNKKTESVSILFLLAIAFAITLLAIVSGARLQTGEKVEVNSVSKQTFKAPADMENRIATEKKRADAYNSVLIVFNKDEEIEQKTYEKLDLFFEGANDLRGEYLNSNSKLENLNKDIENLNKKEPIDEDALIKKNNEKKVIEAELNELFNEEKFSIYLPERLREFLLTLSEEYYVYLQSKIDEVIAETYDLGIKNDDNFDSSLVKIKNEISLVFGDSTTDNLAYALIAEVLEPNLLANIDATEKARKQKESEVEPVVYLKDEIIIGEGQVITTEIYETLNDLGLVQKDYEDVVIFVIGAVGLIIVAFVLVYIYLKTYPSNKLQKSRDFAMLTTIYSLCIVFTWVMGTSLKNHLYGTPILLFTLLISILFGSRFAIVMNIIFSTLAVFIANIDFNIYIYFVLSGIFISINTKNLLEKRNKIILSSVLVGLMTSMIMFGIFLFSGLSDYKLMFQNVGVIFINGFLTVTVAMGTLPIWEVLFGAETTIKLLELTNPDHELLTRLTIEAPGTYHHSLIVSNLAEAAAKDIGANAVWVRVGGYYHDIGKLKDPTNFAENIIGENPHDSLDPYESIRIIKEHVSYGLKLAEEYKLPQIIRDMISMHHGNTLIKFFYNKALNDDSYEDVKEEDFRYEYSIPQYKEAGILMLADTVEAAVRSMIQNVNSMEKVEEFIKKLVKEKIDDGQLQDSELTLKDIDLIKNAFLNVFKGMHHGRIAYPSNDDKDFFDKNANVIIENKSDLNFRSSDENIINTAIFQTLKEEKLKFKIEIDISIVTKEEIKKLNNEHRNIDDETDVLSFPLINKEDIKKEFEKEGIVFLGDIVIAIDKVKEQAEEYNHSFERELGFLVTHSMLHLLGYDHENDQDEKEMFSKQSKILDKAGIKR